MEARVKKGSTKRGGLPLGPPPHLALRRLRGGGGALLWLHVLVVDAHELGIGRGGRGCPTKHMAPASPPISHPPSSTAPGARAGRAPSSWAAVLAASYLKRPRSWERADIFFPRASLAVLAASGMAVWGGHRAYKAFRGKPIPQAASCSAVAPPRGWQRFRPAFAVAGLLGACGVGAALLSRFSPRAAPAPAEGTPPKPKLRALPEFQRLLRATTFRDPVTGEWCCRAPPV